MESQRKGYSLFENLFIKSIPQFKFEYRKESPNILRFELTNNCTAACTYCPRTEILKDGRGFMTLELFDKIMAEGEKLGIKFVGLAGGGEPMLHPKFFEFMKIIEKRNMKVRLATNASLLTKEKAEKLIEGPIASVEFSFDGNDKDQYFKGKQVDLYSVAKKNILYFLSLVKKHKKTFPVNVHFVDIGVLSFKEKVKFLSYWEKELKGVASGGNHIYKEMNWAGANTKKKKDFFELVELRKPCSQLNGISITYSGIVYQCSCNLTSKAILGDLKRQSISEIFTGEKRDKVVKGQISGKFDAGGCDKCTANSFFPIQKAYDLSLTTFSKIAK